MKKILIITTILIGLGIYTIIKADTIMTLDIFKGPIAIDTSGSITLPIVILDTQAGVITGTFSSNTFIIKDTRGSGGYYSTIQFDNLTKGNDTISNENIKLKSLLNPNIIYGETGIFIRFGSGIKNTLANVNLPMTYFVRIPNTGTGYLGEFGDTPEIEITIPANQTGGNYTGIIYYTLIDTE